MPAKNTKVIVGLGNPGEKYDGTRHNLGRMTLEVFRQAQNFPDWTADKRSQALVAAGRVGRQAVLLLCPETMMNRSGLGVMKVLPGRRAAGDLVVIHDDLDLPLGHFRISFNRGSGGHRGVESIIRSLKTAAFTRLRLGIAPAAASGRSRRPLNESAVVNFILSPFKPDEKKIVAKLAKTVSQALTVILTEGYEAAMNRFNH